MMISCDEKESLNSNFEQFSLDKKSLHSNKTTSLLYPSTFAQQVPLIKSNKGVSIGQLLKKRKHKLLKAEQEEKIISIRPEDLILSLEQEKQDNLLDEDYGESIKKVQIQETDTFTWSFEQHCANFEQLQGKQNKSYSSFFETNIIIKGDSDEFQMKEEEYKKLMEAQYELLFPQNSAKRIKTKKQLTDEDLHSELKSIFQKKSLYGSKALKSKQQIQQKQGITNGTSCGNNVTVLSNTQMNINNNPPPYQQQEVILYDHGPEYLLKKVKMLEMCNKHIDKLLWETHEDDMDRMEKEFRVGGVKPEQMLVNIQNSQKRTIIQDKKFEKSYSSLRNLVKRQNIANFDFVKYEEEKQIENNFRRGDGDINILSSYKIMLATPINETLLIDKNKDKQILEFFIQGQNFANKDNLHLEFPTEIGGEIAIAQNNAGPLNPYTSHNKKQISFGTTGLKNSPLGVFENQRTGNHLHSQVVVNQLVGNAQQVFDRSNNTKINCGIDSNKIHASVQKFNNLKKGNFLSNSIEVIQQNGVNNSSSENNQMHIVNSNDNNISNGVNGRTLNDKSILMQTQNNNNNFTLNMIPSTKNINLINSSSNLNSSNNFNVFSNSQHMNILNNSTNLHIANTANIILPQNNQINQQQQPLPQHLNSIIQSEDKNNNSQQNKFHHYVKLFPQAKNSQIEINQSQALIQNHGEKKLDTQQNQQQQQQQFQQLQQQQQSQQQQLLQQQQHQILFPSQQQVNIFGNNQNPLFLQQYLSQQQQQQQQQYIQQQQFMQSQQQQLLSGFTQQILPSQLQQNSQPLYNFQQLNQNQQLQQASNIPFQSQNQQLPIINQIVQNVQEQQQQTQQQSNTNTNPNTNSANNNQNNSYGLMNNFNKINLVPYNTYVTSLVPQNQFFPPQLNQMQYPLQFVQQSPIQFTQQPSYAQDTNQNLLYLQVAGLQQPCQMIMLPNQMMTQLPVNIQQQQDVNQQQQLSQQQQLNYRYQQQLSQQQQNQTGNSGQENLQPSNIVYLPQSQISQQQKK